MQKGFTMIEVLVVIIILGILGVIFTDILTQVLRGQNKINVVSQVKENGQTVLDKLSNEIRGAEKVICIGSMNNLSQTKDTIVIFKKGVYTQFRLFPLPPLGGGALSENGKIIRDDFTGDNILTPPSGDSVADDNQLCTRPKNTPFGNVTVLTNADPVNGVSITPDGINKNDDVFSQNQLAGFSDTITIKFRVFQAINAGKTVESSVGEDGILFATSVQVKGGK